VRKGNIGAATEMAGQALKQQPLSGPANTVMARAEIAAGQLAQAENRLTALSRTNPKSAEISSLFGDLYWARRDIPRARAAYTRALELESDLMSALTGLIKADLVERRTPDAVARIERHASLAGDASFQILAGTVYVAAGNGSKAEGAFRRAVEIDSSRAEAYGLLATLYGMLNRLDEAAREYEQVAQKGGTPAVSAYTMLGAIRAAQGRHADARQQYELALAIDPQAAVAANNLAWDYAERGGNLDLALKLAQTAKQELPDSAEVSDTLGWIYYKKGLATLAISSLSEGVGQDPQNAVIRYHLGLAYLANKQDREARQAFEQALKLDASFPGAEDAKKALASIQG
jgi:Flp pilus assembly protein TadD